MDHATKELQLQLALDDLNTQLKPNYGRTAAKYEGVKRTTLWRRFEGTQVSRRVANAIHRQLLSMAQEEALIKQINDLTARGLPPTSDIVHNLAKEIVSGLIGKNWTRQFVQQHRDQLKSLYLRNIDSMRTKAKFAPLFKLFFDLV
jgi:hypothetical protein